MSCQSHNTPNEHHHSEGCGCGEHHDHEHHEHNHSEGCGCGHDHHEHNHGEGCGCGGHHDHEHHEHNHSEGCGCGEHKTIRLSPEECGFLLTLSQHHYLPLAQFVTTSTQSSHLESLALSTVYLVDGTETVEQLRSRGEMLKELEAKELISLDYDLPLTNFDYGIYENSVAFHALEEMVREGSQKEGFLFDGARVETGSISPTEMGQMVMEQLLNQ